MGLPSYANPRIGECDAPVSFVLNVVGDARYPYPCPTEVT